MGRAFGFLVSVVGVALSACVSVGGDGPVVGRYLGYVAVRAPAAGVEIVDTTAGGVSEPTPAIGQSDVAVLGAWLDTGKAPRGGAGLGWRRSHLVLVPPDCRLVVMVQTDAQLQSAEQLLAGTSKGDGTCVVKQ